MAIKVWVVWAEGGAPVEGADCEASSPADAILLAEQYREIFEDDGIVRIHAGRDLSNRDLNLLLDLAVSKGIALQSAFP